MVSKTIIKRSFAPSKSDAMRSAQIRIDFSWRRISVHRKPFYRMKTWNWSPIYRRIEFRWVAANAIEKSIWSKSTPTFQMEPTSEQIKCVIEHLESEKNVSSSSLWSAIANDLDEMNGEPKRSITFWKRTFKRIIKRLTAKRELVEHIAWNYLTMEGSKYTLKPLENVCCERWYNRKWWTRQIRSGRSHRIAHRPERRTSRIYRRIVASAWHRPVRKCRTSLAMMTTTIELLCWTNWIIVRVCCQRYAPTTVFRNIFAWAVRCCWKVRINWNCCAPKPKKNWTKCNDDRSINRIALNQSKQSWWSTKPIMKWRWVYYRRSWYI